MSSPSPLRTPDTMALAMIDEGVGLGSSGCVRVCACMRERL